MVHADRMDEQGEALSASVEEGVALAAHDRTLNRASPPASWVLAFWLSPKCARRGWPAAALLIDHQQRVDQRFERAAFVNSSCATMLPASGWGQSLAFQDGLNSPSKLWAPQPQPFQEGSWSQRGSALTIRLRPSFLALYKAPSARESIYERLSPSSARARPTDVVTAWDTKGSLDRL